MAALRSRYRHGGRWWGTGMTLAAALVALVFVAFAVGAPKPPPPTPVPEVVGTVGHLAGFEDNDGNMAANATGDGTNSLDSSVINEDWNKLAANPSYGDTSEDPYGAASGTTDGWQWTALNDAAAVTSDSGFAGGVKQDDDCAAVIGSKAPNKDDLKRAYLATKKGTNGHIYLELAWVRIPQNTTSASAHIGFEFNQASSDPTTGSPCGTGSDGLVHRTLNDLLLVYDFTGGSTVPPTINLSRWVTSGACQVGSDSPPCWGTFTALNPCDAEANVNTGLTHTAAANGNNSDGCGTNEKSGVTYQLPSSITDHLAPTSDDGLGASEFGEAGIDLTNSGVFGSGCVSFGQVYAVSRSSGDSNTAAMEDLVGPGHFTLSNCTTDMTTTPQVVDTSTDPDTFSDLSGTPASGTTIADKATVTVTGATTWTGNVSFYLCYDASTVITSCTPVDSGQGANKVGSSKAVSNSTTGGIVYSDETTASNAGNYCWAAKFVHSTPTGLPDKTVTTGECFSVNTPTTLTTRQYFYPQDKVRISAGSGGNIKGTVYFTLYDTQAHCQADIANEGASYTPATLGKLFAGSTAFDGTASGAQTATTSNSDYAVSTANTAQTVYWHVFFHSTNASQTDSNDIVSGACSETTIGNFTGNDTTNITSAP